REEYFRQLADEISLLFGGEHQIAVALFLSRQSSKDPASNAKIRRAHMRTFLGSFEAESDAAKIRGPHSNKILNRRGHREKPKPIGWPEQCPPASLHDGSVGFRALRLKAVR